VKVAQLVDFLKINSYLYYGYGLFPGPQQPELPFPISFLTNCHREYTGVDEADLVSIGSETLTNICQTVGMNSNRIQVIPLSGGLDSRAILAGFLENGQKENLVTVTFGTPETLDFEIGRLVAREAGVRHETIDLTQVPITTEKLVETVQSKGAQWTGVFDAFYNRLIPTKLGDQAVYWSGFLGDRLTGSDLQMSGADTWPLARIRFVETQRYCRSIPLFHPDFNPLSVLPQEPICSSNALSYYEQLDFALRQRFYIRPILLSPAENWRTPFLDEQWVCFILSVPREYREGQKLYKLVLSQKFPYIFRLPTKKNLGLPLQPTRYDHISRRLKSRFQRLMELLLSPVGQRKKSVPLYANYLDFNEAIREREDIKKLVYENLQDLKERKIIDWLDINAIWATHQARIGDYGAALITLTGLEINLKVQDSKVTNNVEVVIGKFTD
jgi:hypothetical protein